MINSVPNTAGSASGLSPSGGLQTQVALKASDVFALKDPVFADWKTGECLNLNSMVTGPALAAGPALSTFTAAEGTYLNNSNSTANAMRLPDGSMLVLVAALDGAAQAAYYTLRKYSVKGVLLTSMLLASHIPGNGSTMPMPTGLCLALLDNGNYAVSYAYQFNSMTNWAIISPNMQLLFTGTTTTQSTGGFHLQPVTGGGFLLSYSKGLNLISAAGVVSSVFAIDTSGYSLGLQDELLCDGLKADTPQNATLLNYQPVILPAGGYGYFFSSATGYSFHKVSAAGALVTSVVLASWGAQAFYGGRAALSATTGNIAWVCNSTNAGGFYGVISQDGAVVKASASAGIKQYSTSMRLLADAAGGFVLCTWDGAVWNVRCMSATGIDLAGFPKVLLNGASIIMAERTHVMSLSTGTLFLAGIGADPYGISYAWISTAGVIKTGLLYSFKNAGNSAMVFNATVINDTVYGFCATGAAQGGGVPDLVMFTVSNTGEVVRAPYFLGSVVYYESLKIALDYTGKYLYVAFGLGNQTPGTSMVATFDLSNLSLVQTYTIPFAIQNCRVRAYSQGLYFFDHSAVNTSQFPKATPPTFGVFVKPRSTTLVGVAATPAAKGDVFPVESKGLFSLSDAWKSVAQTFDQSVSNPPGNSGSINNSLINLKGF